MDFDVTKHISRSQRMEIIETMTETEKTLYEKC